MKKLFLILIAAVSLVSCSKKDEAYPTPAKQETNSPANPKSNSTPMQPLRHDKNGTVREPNQSL